MKRGGRPTRASFPGTELDKLINAPRPGVVGQRDPQGQPHRAPAVRRQDRRLCQLRPQPRPQPHYDGEIYELYLRPEFQGLGFGRRLFTAARRDLAQSALKSLIVWALSENDNAVEFYRALGGKAVARSSEKFGTRVLDKVAFGWQN